MSIRQHNVSVASSWRGLLLWYHNVTTLRLTHSRPQECPHSPYLSLFWVKLFFSPLSFGFALFLYVFLTLFLSVLGMCKHRLSSRSLSRVHAHWEGGREETSALCTQTWQSVTDTQANANNGSNACGKMRKCRGGSEAPPLPTYTWDFTYEYIHKTLLPWQQVFSYLGTLPFQCRNSSLKSLPALPCF